MEWRSWVVIHPARLAVIGNAAVNAEVGPGTVQRVRGLKPAHCAARVAVDPDRVPGGSIVVVQSNRVAKGIGESVDVGEGSAAVSRE